MQEIIQMLSLISFDRMGNGIVAMLSIEQLRRVKSLHPKLFPSVFNPLCHVCLNVMIIVELAYFHVNVGKKHKPSYKGLNLIYNCPFVSQGRFEGAKMNLVRICFAKLILKVLNINVNMDPSQSLF